MKLYTCSACQQMINAYIEKGGNIETIEEGILGFGFMILYGNGLKTTIIQEVPINEWSSAHKIRSYNTMPEKYRKILERNNHKNAEVNHEKIEEKLFTLQKACNRYKNIDRLADWVLYAIDRYISTGRANLQFERAFVSYPDERMEELIRICLNGDRSDDGIIKTVKKVIAA